MTARSGTRSRAATASLTSAYRSASSSWASAMRKSGASHSSGSPSRRSSSTLDTAAVYGPRGAGRNRDGCNELRPACAHAWLSSQCSPCSRTRVRPPLRSGGGAVRCPRRASADPDAEELAQGVVVRLRRFDVEETGRVVRVQNADHALLLGDADAGRNRNGIPVVEDVEVGVVVHLERFTRQQGDAENRRALPEL